MKITKPGYYDDFRCLAGACPDSCCQEWDVQVDAQTGARYLALEGSLGHQLRQVLKPDGEGYIMEIADRRCPMWRSDGLCQIQAELGHEGLCQVCREFPRLRHDYGDFMELGLELSCPEAARLILTSKTPDISREEAGGEAPEYDQEATEVLLRTREQALSLLENRPVGEALALLLLYGYQAQEELDGSEEVPFSPAKELEFGRQVGRATTSLTDFYAGLDILTPRWAERLAHPHFEGWKEEHRAMARCCVQRYWLQAVSDYDLICRVKFIVAGCLLVAVLGGDPIETAQLYSKEIDNSIDNVEAILDGAYTHPALTDANLLGLLTQLAS